MKRTPRHEHPSAERLQALLESELRGAELAGAEEHLAGCERCSAELEAWRTLFSELAELPALEPSRDFATGVLSRIETPARAPLAARVRQRVGTLLGRPAGTHVRGWLQDLVAGTLPARRATRVEAHLAACAECAGEAETWRAVFRRLDALGRFAPAAGFAERVMAALTAHAPAAVPSPATVPAWHRLLAAARSLVPRTRRAWAAISGVAVTPAVTAGLALYVVFSHPTLTPGALVSFVWWKTGELGGAAWQAITAGALDSARLFDLYAVAEWVAAAPMTLAGGAVAYSLASVLAARVLYKNLIAPRPVREHGHA